MNEAWRARLREWRNRTAERLKARWWLYVLISLVLGQLKDYAQGEINAYVTRQSSAMSELLRFLLVALSPVGLAAVILAVCVAVVALLAYFDVRRDAAQIRPTTETPTEPEQAPAPPEPLAVPDSAERLLDLFKHWDQALGLAAYVLDREICSYGSSEETQLLSYAIRTFPLEISKGKLIELRRKFEYFVPRETTQIAFSTLRVEMRQTLQECNFLLVFWINKGGAVIRGEQILSVPVYIGFCDAYREALEAARSLRFHSELGILAKALVELETKPTPPIDPPPSKASGQAPPP